MSSSSSGVRVLRGGAAGDVRAARLDAELRDHPYASALAVDARLTDPHLERVVAEIAAAAAESARTQGFAQGLAEGRAEAVRQAALTAAAQAQHDAAVAGAAQTTRAHELDVLRAATRALREREATALGEVEAVVVDLALRLARAVLDRELAVAASPGREALQRALALAPHGGRVVARLHPSDAAAVGELDDLAAGRELVVLPDSGVEPGGCVVETAGSRIDAQVGPALERAALALTGQAPA